MNVNNAMINHGVNVRERPTNISPPVIVPVSIPFVIGAAPVQSATDAPPPGQPVLVRDWNDAVAKLGYSDEWDKYNLCEFMDSHFRLYKRSPVVFCNLLNPESMFSAVSAADFTVSDHKVFLPLDAVNDEHLVIRQAGGSGSAFEKGSDYETFYSGSSLVVEFLSSGAAFSLDTVSVAYRQVTPESVTNNVVAMGMESYEYVVHHTGIIADLIVSPRYSKDPVVAAAMTVKAKGIFGAKALIDIDTGLDGGARSCKDAPDVKELNNLFDEDQIVCWPMISSAGKIYHYSSHLAGVMATIDNRNDDIPYESPSNEVLLAEAVVLEDGTPVVLTHAEANLVESNGIVTAFRFINGLTTWGNYTACFPGNIDPKDFFININRMFDWVANSLIYTYWVFVDRPMNLRNIESIKDSINIWLNGLVGGQFLLGGRVEFRASENPTENLMRGIAQFDIFLTPPPPLAEIKFKLEFDLGYFDALTA